MVSILHACSVSVTYVRENNVVNSFAVICGLYSIQLVERSPIPLILICLTN